MGARREPFPVLPVCAIFSRHSAALDWARAQLDAAWGPILARSAEFDFDQTSFYERWMGSGLRKQLLTFARPADPGDLPSWKIQSDSLEAEYAKLGRHAEPRPLNIDPGYLTLGKFVLASTKDHIHRIYLRDGIYAEVTLFFKHGRWEPWTWTYPDYRLPAVHEFLTAGRQWLFDQRREEPQS